MAISATLTVVQQISVTALVTDGLASGYTDRIVFTGGVDFTPATLAQMLTALGLTQAQIKQMFIDRYQTWQTNQAVIAPPPTVQQAQAAADALEADQEKWISQMDAASRITYLTALQARIAAKLAQGG